MNKSKTTIATPEPLLSPPHIAGEHVHCLNCGQMAGIVTSGGNLLLLTGHTVRFPTTIKCPCGHHLKLGKRFQNAREYAPRESYPNPRPGLYSLTVDAEELDTSEQD